MKSILIFILIYFPVVSSAQFENIQDTLTADQASINANAFARENSIQTREYFGRISSEKLFGPKNIDYKKLKMYDLSIADTISKKKTFIYDSIFQIDESQNSIFIEFRNQKTDFLLPVLLLGILIYFTWLRFQFHKQIKENITILFNLNLAQQIFRDREFSMGIFRILILGNIIFIFGVYFYQFFQYYDIQLPFKKQMSNILFSFTIFPIIYFLKSFAYFLVQIVFNQKSIFRFFRFNTMVIYQLLSIVLLPCIILMASVDEPLLKWVFYFTYVLIAVAFLIRVVKGILLLPQVSSFRISYFFMYICGLEIVPLIIAYKLIISGNL